MVGPAGCVVRASERISVLVTIKTNQSVAKHAADDGQHVCRFIYPFHRVHRCLADRADRSAAILISSRLSPFLMHRTHAL